MNDTYTPEQIRSMARDHVAYGWARSPWGHWTAEQNRIYDKEYDDATFLARHGYTKEEATESSYVAKLMDACETEEEANAIMDFYAG
jgi:hypothetical protein